MRSWRPLGWPGRTFTPTPGTAPRPDPTRAPRGTPRRTLAAADPLEIERKILLVAAADLEAGRELSAEDRARVEIAVERLDAAQERSAA